MTARIGIRELRQNLSAAVRRVERGETLEVTRDGRPVALLSRVPPERTLERLLAEGVVHPPTEPLDVFLKLRRLRSKGVSASDALQRDRGE